MENNEQTSGKKCGHLGGVRATNVSGGTRGARQRRGRKKYEKAPHGETLNRTQNPRYPRGQVLVKSRTRKRSGEVLQIKKEGSPPTWIFARGYPLRFLSL